MNHRCQCAGLSPGPPALPQQPDHRGRKENTYWLLFCGCHVVKLPTWRSAANAAWTFRARVSCRNARKTTHSRWSTDHCQLWRASPGADGRGQAEPTQRLVQFGNRAPAELCELLLESTQLLLEFFVHRAFLLGRREVGAASTAVGRAIDLADECRQPAIESHRVPERILPRTRKMHIHELACEFEHLVPHAANRLQRFGGPATLLLEAALQFLQLQPCPFQLIDHIHDAIELALQFEQEGHLLADGLRGAQ